MKACTKCGKSYPYTAEFFTRTKSRSVGLDIYCRPCRREIARAFYLKNRESEIRRSAGWNKRNPERVLANIAKCRERRREHFNQWTRDWRAKNKDKVKAYDAQKRHKRRAATRNTECKATAKDIHGIFKASNGSCFYCGKVAKLTLDHVIPLSKGGTHSVGNLVAACLPCNMAKGAKDPSVFCEKFGYKKP